MTCVLPTNPWHHFNDHLPWLPMNTDTASSDSKPHSQGYVSPGSDARKSSTSSGKKRASRAGTRSVTTLSAAQLERKRANDREAQRAIRQRTKDHIDHLERSINELRGSQESTEKLVHMTQQRIRELEDENAYLRSKLNETGMSISLLPADSQRGPEPPLLTVPSSSPGPALNSSIHRPGSTSAPSNHTATVQSSSRNGSWQHQSAGFIPTSSTAVGLPSAASIAGGPRLTTWRSHEPGQNLQDQVHPVTSAGYHQDQRIDWPGTAASYQHYVSQEHQRPQQYETASTQQPGCQPPVQGYGTSATPQSSAYHNQLAPQNDFPSISVSPSSSAFQVQGQANFQQPASFQVRPMQVPSSGAGYSSPHGQMQPPALPDSTFPVAPGDQSYAAQQPHPSIPYRDEAANRSYSITHYQAA